MSDLRNIEWLDPLPDHDSSPELVKFYKHEVGFVPPYVQWFASCPWIQHADIDLDISFASAEITGMFDLIYLVVGLQLGRGQCGVDAQPDHTAPAGGLAAGFGGELSVRSFPVKSRSDST